MPEEENDAESQELLRRVKNAAAVLIEHCDSVQVFVTKQQDDGAVGIHFGAGNFYARYGQIEEWVRKCKKSD